MRDFCLRYIIKRNGQDDIAPEQALLALARDLLRDHNITDINVANIHMHELVLELLETAQRHVKCALVARTSFSCGPRNQSGLFISFLGGYKHADTLISALKATFGIVVSLASIINGVEVYFINSAARIDDKTSKDIDNLKVNDLITIKTGSLLKEQYDFNVKTYGMEYLDMPELEIQMVPFRARHMAGALLIAIAKLLLTSTQYRIGHIDNAPGSDECIRLEIAKKIIHARLVYDAQSYRVVSMAKGVGNLVDVLYHLIDDRTDADTNVTATIRKSAQEDLATFHAYLNDANKCFFVKKKFDFGESSECLWAKVMHVENGIYTASLIDIPRLRIDLSLTDPIKVADDEIMDWAVIAANDGKIVAGHYSSVWQDDSST